MTDESTPEVVQCADDAYEAIRSINHLTISTRSLPAPLVYQVLGNFKGVGNMQALNQLAAGLGKSLDTHVVYEDDGREQSTPSSPNNSVQNWQTHKAPSAGQGYREK